MKLPVAPIPASKTTIFVHCLATRATWMQNSPAARKMAEVTKWHKQERGWRDNAYALLVDRDGEYAIGRDLDNDGDPWEETGAGAKGWNTNGIHLVLAGGHGSNADDDFFDHFTEAQDVALRKAINHIQELADYRLDVRGHNEVTNKACPGFQVSEWLNYGVAPEPPQEPQNLVSIIINAIMGLF